MSSGQKKWMHTVRVTTTISHTVYLEAATPLEAEREARELVRIANENDPSDRAMLDHYTLVREESRIGAHSRVLAARNRAKDLVAVYRSGEGLDVHLNERFPDGVGKGRLVARLGPVLDHEDDLIGFAVDNLGRGDSRLPGFYRPEMFHGGYLDTAIQKLIFGDRQREAGWVDVAVVFGTRVRGL